jgi:hypothetical protein
MNNEKEREGSGTERERGVEGQSVRQRETLRARSKPLELSEKPKRREHI